MAELALQGRLRHQTGGRVRIGLESPLPDEAALQGLVEWLGGLRGVQTVEIRPTTGSLIILHDGEFAPIAKAIADAGTFTFLPPEEAAPIDPIGDTMHRLSAADAAIGRLSGGRTDLLSVVFAGLVIAGIAQMARGRVAGPALTLFGQAATLAMTRPFFGLQK